VYELALAVVWQETDFRNVIGDGGDSVGYMQVQKKYHGDRMERLGVTDLFDPYSNFLVGCDYLVELVEKYGDIEKALVAYNQGEFKGVVTEYALGVLDKFDRLDGGALDEY
jgi:soluble lytic murein transglycosylase-like protein